MPFSIGKYRDEVYCDIVDMDACHLLFGRPWQYDVDAQHAGKDNQYRLEKDGIRYALLPLKLLSRPKGFKPEGRSFLTITQSDKEMEEVIKESREVHALVVKHVMKVEEEGEREVYEGVK